MKELFIENIKIPFIKFVDVPEYSLLGAIKFYHYILPYVENKIILDVGCGYGYGSYLLAHKAKSVVGIDIQINRIKIAKNIYQKDNIKFYWLDALSLNKKFCNNSFDVVVASQFIEHIKKPVKFLKIVYNLLSDNGLLILSTPNKIFRKTYGKPWNPEHVQEFDELSLKELILKVFKDVKIIGITGTREVLEYEKIRTGGNLPPRIKKLWRYIPNSLKTFIRKTIKSNLPKDIKVDDFVIEDKVTENSFSLLSFCYK